MHAAWSLHTQHDSCLDTSNSAPIRNLVKNTSLLGIPPSLPFPTKQCPRGTYRGKEKARGVNDCALCPVNTYQNTTGATAQTDCIRCPDGFFAEEEGTAECNCMTEDSCLPEWQNYQRDSTPYIGRQ